MRRVLLVVALFSNQEPAGAPGAERAALERELDAWRAGATAPARAELERMQAEAEGLGLDGELLSAFGALGHHLLTLGAADEADELIAWVGDWAELEGASETHEWSLDWRAQHLWQRGDLDGAAALLERSAAVAEERGDAGARVRHLADVARIRLSQGDLDAALSGTERVESIARASGSRAALRASAEVRGSLLFELGRHRAALELCLELSPAPGEEAPEDEVQVRLDLLASNVLSDIGRLESAADFARRAHELALSAPVQRTAPLLHLEAKLTLGLLWGDLGRIGEGLALLDEAAAEFERRDDPRGRAWTEKNRGWVLFAARRFGEARAAFEVAERGGRELALPYLEGLCALGVAECLVFGTDDARGLDRDRFRSEIAVASARADELAERQLRWRIAAAQGRSHLLENRPEEALRELERAVQGIERWRARLGAPGLIEHALRQRSDPYREAALAAARLGRTDDALRFTALCQARVLSALRARDTGPPQRDDPALDELCDRLARAELRLRQDADEATKSALRETIEGLDAELDRALLAGELAGPRARANAEGSPTGARLRAALERSELDVALVYLVGAERTLAFALDERACELRILDVGREALGALVARLRAPFEALAAGELDLANLGFDVRAARELHDLLVRPFDLPDGACVGVLADDCLTSIPFELLVVDGEPAAVDPERPFAHLARLRFLGDDHALATYGSLDDLARDPGPLLEGRALVFLPPERLGVTRGREEARAVARGLSERSVELVPDATVADVLARASGAALVHFAAHGHADPATPARGHLILGDAAHAGEPERLEAWRIEELDLGGALAVLSACHTGEGEWRPGAGIAGLARGFLVGGAREVVASQWAVDDAVTASFMEAFYAALARGETTPFALRTARRALRRSDDPRGFVLAHPYFWAAWIVQR